MDVNGTRLPYIEQGRGAPVVLVHGAVSDLRKISLMGGDTSANDAQPVGEIAGEAVPCHEVAQTRRGIWNIENLDFEPLLRERVYEFVFVWSPLKIVGATGSPGNPVAIW